MSRMKRDKKKVSIVLKKLAEKYNFDISESFFDQLHIPESIDLRELAEYFNEILTRPSAKEVNKSIISEHELGIVDLMESLSEKGRSENGSEKLTREKVIDKALINELGLIDMDEMFRNNEDRYKRFQEQSLYDRHAMLAESMKIQKEFVREDLAKTTGELKVLKLQLDLLKKENELKETCIKHNNLAAQAASCIAEQEKLMTEHGIVAQEIKNVYSKLEELKSLHPNIKEWESPSKKVLTIDGLLESEGGNQKSTNKKKH